MERFIRMQEQYFATALEEIKRGRKRSHWIWYIFPQMTGLGLSENSRYYGVKNLQEAQEFLDHPMLGNNLINISNELLQLKKNNATDIFGYPDDMKLQSSMTLFSLVSNANPVFQHVLDKYFDGEKDQRTIELLKEQ